MAEKRTRTHVSWSVYNTDEDDAGRLTHVTLRRRVRVNPLTADHRREQWQRGEETTEEVGPFHASEIPDVIKELSEALLYYANGDRAKDRALERGETT